MSTHPQVIPPDKRSVRLKGFLLKQLAVIEGLKAKHPRLVPEGASPFLYLTYPWFGEPHDEEQRKLLETSRAQFQAAGFEGKAVVKELHQIISEDSHLRECCPTTGELSQFLDNFFFEVALHIQRAGGPPDRIERFFEEDFIPATYHQGPFKSIALSHLFNFDATQTSIVFGDIRAEKLEGRTVAGFFGEPTLRSFFHPQGTGDFFVVGERLGPCDDWIAWLFVEKFKAEQFARVLQYYKDGVAHVDYTVPYFLPPWVNHIRKWGTYFLGNPRRKAYKGEQVISMVVLVVSWIAKPGKEEEVARLFAKLQEESRKEPGCLLYVAQRHQYEPARFLVYEQYKDDAALEAHRTTKHFLEIARGNLPKLADRVDANLYTPI